MLSLINDKNNLISYPSFIHLLTYSSPVDKKKQSKPTIDSPIILILIHIHGD